MRYGSPGQPCYLPTLGDWVFTNVIKSKLDRVELGRPEIQGLVSLKERDLEAAGRSQLRGDWGQAAAELPKAKALGAPAAGVDSRGLWGEHSLVAPITCGRLSLRTLTECISAVWCCLRSVVTVAPAITVGTQSLLQLPYNADRRLTLRQASSHQVSSMMPPFHQQGSGAVLVSMEVDSRTPASSWSCAC